MLNLTALSLRHRLGLLIGTAVICMLALATLLVLDSKTRIKQFHVQSAKTGLTATLAFLDQQYAQALRDGQSQEAAQQDALNWLRELRFSEGEGYVAVLDDTGFVLMHPIHAHWNEVNNWDQQDITGAYITREAIAIGKTQGIGVNSYYFEHPLTGKMDVKTSAVGRFDPWGWTLVSGVFNQSVQASSADMLRHALWVVMLMSLIFLLIALVIGSSLARPMLRLVQSMISLAKGDLDTEIPYQHYKNDSGSMARALAVFRERGRENIALQAANARAQEKRDAERRSFAEQLRTEFAEVITAVRRGDFTRRVHTDSPDQELSALAAGLNELIETLQSNMVAVEQALSSLSAGKPLPSDAREFEGAFSDLLDHVSHTANTVNQQSTYLEYTAHHDALTGLPNRRFFDQRLASLTNQSNPNVADFALLHIDLDHFKQVNDDFGHEAGDALLVWVANTLNTLLSEQDFIARIGGDEFVVICPVSPNTADNAMRLANQIIAECSTPIPLEHGLARIGASIGIARSIDGPNVLQNADLALYRAKRAGRNKVYKFTPSMRLAALRSKQMEDDIIRGLEAGEFVAYMQPQINAATGSIIGAEALARWEHPTRGVIKPEAFLPIAEQSDLLRDIDTHITRAAFLIVQKAEKQHLRVPKLSLNLSGQRLMDPDFPAFLETLPPLLACVAFELLESIAFDDLVDTVIDRTSALKQAGYGIEIDDFGTGRTSITGLLQIAPHRLKIDRQLIEPIFGAGPERKLIEAIIDMARNLKIETIAEGVETQAHAQLLRKLGADALQGFAFAPALCEDDFIAYLRRAALDKTANSS